MHRMMHRSHVGDNRVVSADRVAALYITPKNIKINVQWMVTSKMEAGKNDTDRSLDWAYCTM